MENPARSSESQGMGVRQPSRPLNAGQNAIPYGSRSASYGNVRFTQTQLFTLEYANRAAQRAYQRRQLGGGMREVNCSSPSG